MRRLRGLSRADRTLLALLAVAFVVSVVHYVDNVANYADYPQPGPDALPAPSAALIAVSWFGFTACGVAGAWWRQAHVVVDILCGLAVLGFAVWAVARRRRVAG